MDGWKDQRTSWMRVPEKELLDEMKKVPAASEAHALDHMLRVVERCERLGKELDADPEILAAAVYPHDLGRGLTILTGIGRPYVRTRIGSQQPHGA
jgi:HD superfamily phosphodiesterase